MELQEKVIQKLRETIDPGTLSDVISMGLIQNLTVTKDGKVSLEFQPASSVCPLVFSLALDIQKSLQSLGEIKDLSITIRNHQMADEINRYLKEEQE